MIDPPAVSAELADDRAIVVRDRVLDRLAGLPRLGGRERGADRFEIARADGLVQRHAGTREVVQEARPARVARLSGDYELRVGELRWALQARQITRDAIRGGRIPGALGA